MKATGQRPHPISDRRRPSRSKWFDAESFAIEALIYVFIVIALIALLRSL